MILNLGCIVEGHGEEEAVPMLLRRIQRDVCSTLDLTIQPLMRISRCKLVRPRELERAVDFLARRIRPPRAILILMDADDSLPCELAPQLLSRARATRPDVPIGVVLAQREFEAWFLAAIESLRGKRGLAADLQPVDHVESIRDAKGALTARMAGPHPYSPVPDQPALTAQFDMELARSRSPSFDKCWREITGLFAAAAPESQESP